MRKVKLALHLLILISIKVSHSYVFDSKHAVTLNPRLQDASSAFGYSLDFAKDNKGQAWLLVGAPKALDSGNERGGSVNACRLGSSSFSSSASRIQCSERPANLQSAKPGAIFGDQLLGVTVVTADSTFGEVQFCPQTLHAYFSVIGSSCNTADTVETVSP